MFSRSRSSRQDAARFLALAGAVIAASLAAAVALRLGAGDTEEAAGQATAAVALGASAAAAAGVGLVALAAAALPAVAFAVLSGFVLMFAGALILPVILPGGLEAVGPGAMALMLPVLAWSAAGAIGLCLRALRALLGRR
jgi:hypothetical protein